MEPEVNQPEITEEKPSTDISTEETKVSETKEQDIDRLVQSAVDKRLAPIYQERDSYKQEAEIHRQTNDALQKQIEELDSEISRIQDTAYKDDPELLRDAKSKRQLLKDKRQVEQEKETVKREQINLGLRQKAIDIAEISARTGVNAKVLERADVRNKQELEDFAREIAGEPKPETKKETPVYDKGFSDASSGKHFTSDSIANMSSKEYKENKDAIEEALREGRIT